MHIVKQEYTIIEAIKITPYSLMYSSNFWKY